MRRFPAAKLLAALISVLFLALITACGGTKPTTPTAATITLTPASMSLNEGQVLSLSAVSKNSSGQIVVVDITFTSSNTNLVTVSPGGLVCGGKFDSNNVVCTPNGDGQATVTATSGTASATATVYVHKQVDRVVITPINDCSSMGTLISPTAAAYNTSAQGCSNAAPCDITSTVGPFSYGSGNLNVVATATGIDPNYSSTTNSPTYNGGGSISGSAGQTCNLTDFSVGGGTGIDPTFSPSKNSPTYTSGGTITGTAGQTCTLISFNGLTGASATVTLTGPNTIASGTQLDIATPGVGGVTPPTTATLGSGTATCSGTANVITSLLTTVGINPVIGATGTVALTGANAIAVGTKLTITNPGYGAVSAPTTATLTNGTATCSGTASVVTSLNSVTGLTAQAPGSTVLFASVSGVNSVGSPFLVCPVSSILVHDASSSNTNFVLTGGQTQNLVADVLDTKGMAIKPSLTWASSEPAAVNLSTSANTNATITGAAPGTSSVTATCSQNCNIDLPPVYSYNVVTASVGGTSATNVYAASTQSLTLVPISTNTNAVGTAITLPTLPNSILASVGKVYLGADSGGVMAIDTATGTITRLLVNGKVIAVTADGSGLIISDGGNGVTYYFDVTTNSIVAVASSTTSSGVITPDASFALFLGAQQLIREGVDAAVLSTNLGFTPDAIGLLAQGSLSFVTSSSKHFIDIRSTCDSSDLQTLSAGSPTLVQGLPNGTGAVAVDSPNLDLITTPQPSGSCPVVSNSTLNSYDLQAGNFTPKQLFVSYDSSRAWVISDQSSLLSFDLVKLTPTAIPLAGGFQAFSGGITLDSQQVYVGASDNKVHRITVPTLSDDVQFDVGLKDASSNAVAPNLVVVQPK